VPSALWVVDTKKEHIAVSEARKLGIPVVAILDTNCDPDEVTYPIPGNDDAIRSVALLTRVVADAVADGLIARAGAAANGEEKPAAPADGVLGAEEPLAEWERALLEGRAADGAEDTAAETTADTAAGAPADTAAETTADTAAETTADTAAETTADTAAGTPADTAAETTADTAEPPAAEAPADAAPADAAPADGAEAAGSGDAAAADAPEEPASEPA